MSADADALVADALAALRAKLARDGLPRFHDTRMVVVHAALALTDERVERLLGYFLDADQRLLAIEELAGGAADTAKFSRSHIARRALAVNADSCVIIHNHCSGAAEASAADRDASDAIDRQLAAIGVLVAGHFVVSKVGYGDIRTGQIVEWGELARTDEQSSPAARPRCPHCLGLLEENST